MDPNTGTTRPIDDAEIDRLVSQYGRPFGYGDIHPETGEVMVSAAVAHAQRVGQAELSRRERRDQARAARGAQRRRGIPGRLR